jgi:hypothetical protein
MMQIKLFIRTLLTICSLAILAGMWAGAVKADEPIESQANTTIFLPLVIKSGSSGCQISNLLQNGSFENGPAAWTQISSGGYQMIGVEDFAYNGTWLALLGGYNNANDRLFQTFNVPAGCKALKIVVYAGVYTKDSKLFAYDKLYGSLQPVNSVSNPEALIATNKNHTNNPYWRRMTYIYNQIPNPGQPLRLYLRGATDGSLYTNFWIDLVSVQASAQPFPLPATSLQTADGGVIGWEIESVPGEPAADLTPNNLGWGRDSAR